VAQQPKSGLDRLTVKVPSSDKFRHTHTTSRTPLNEWSAHLRSHYLHNTQHTQQTNIHAVQVSNARSL